MLRRFAKTGRIDRESRVVELGHVVTVAVVGNSLANLHFGNWGPTGPGHPTESTKGCDFRQLFILTAATYLIGTKLWPRTEATQTLVPLGDDATPRAVLGATSPRAA